MLIAATVGATLTVNQFSLRDGGEVQGIGIFVCLTSLMLALVRVALAPHP